MSGKYDFKVSFDLIEMIEAESKVIVNWSYNVKILKGSCDKYNLNRVWGRYYTEDYDHPLGQL
jgi:hypothetical protein